MILRRITDAFRKQDWFTVFIETLIVVLGVFIGLQVNNWNESRQQHALKGYYLERLEADLGQTLTHLSDQNARSLHYRDIIDTFLSTLNDPDTSDEDLVRALEDYLANGTNLLGLNATTATFDDLSATGNLDVLDNPTLVEALVGLHTTIDRYAEDLEVNTAWVQPQESGLAKDFDWLRYDAKTRHLFPAKPTAQLAGEARDAEDMLRRHAALHYWLLKSVSEDYEDAADKTESVLAMVRQELGTQP